MFYVWLREEIAGVIVVLQGISQWHRGMGKQDAAGAWGVRVIVVPVAVAANPGGCFVSRQQTGMRALGGYSRQISGVSQQTHCAYFVVLRYNLCEWTWSA